MDRLNVVGLPRYPLMILVPEQQKRNRPLNDVPVQSERGKIEHLSRDIEPTFGCFQKLPENLRLRIWNLLLPGPRLVEISAHAPRHRSTPVILHVCSESRKEALRSYTAFPLELASNPSKTVRAHVYVNFQIDTLYFNVHSFCGYFGPMLWSVSEYAHQHQINRLMNRVRSLAIRRTALTGKPLYTEMGIQLKLPLFHRFDKLERLAVVENDSEGDGKITDLEIRDEWQMALPTSGENDRGENRLRSEQLIDNFNLRHSNTDRKKVESELIKQCHVVKNDGISKKWKVQIVVMHRQSNVKRLDQLAQPLATPLYLAAMPHFL